MEAVHGDVNGNVSSFMNTKQYFVDFFTAHTVGDLVTMSAIERHLFSD